MGLVRHSRYCRTMFCLLAVMWVLVAYRFANPPSHRAPSLISGIDPVPVVDEEQRAGLDRPIPLLFLRDTGLGDALDLLGRETHATILVRWSKLGELQLTPQTPVSLSLHDVTLATALRVILRQASPELTYGVTPGAVVVVTSGWDAPKTLAIHDLRAIHPAPAMDLSGSGLKPLPINQEEFVYVLSNFLATTDSSPNPSPSARVAPWGGSLIAVETPENHRRLRVILEGLRDTISRPGLGKPPSARSRLLALLEQPMGEVRFDGVTLEEAIDGLRKQSHANIVVDWPALESVGVERLAKVRMRLWNVPLRLALSTLFTNQRGKDPGLDFDVEENVITVTQFSSLLGDVRVYDVRDLVAASVARRSATLAAIAKALPSAPTNLNPLSQEQIETEENGYFARLVLDMVDHIELHNDRSDLISAWYGRLLIRASPTVHKDIEEFLRRLRESVRDADGVGAGEPAIGPGNRPSADGKPQ